MSDVRPQPPLYDRRRLEQLVMAHRIRVLQQQRRGRHTTGDRK